MERKQNSADARLSAHVNDILKIALQTDYQLPSVTPCRYSGQEENPETQHERAGQGASK